MKWSIHELQIEAREPLVIDTNIDLKRDIMKKYPEIVDTTLVSVKGMLLYEDHTVLAQLQIALTVTLPSTRSLALVDVDLEFPIKERYIEEGWKTDIIDDKTTIQLSLTGNTVDLSTAIVDHVVLNIPTQRFTAEEEVADSLPHGEEWAVLTEDLFRQSKQANNGEIDPRFAALKNWTDDDRNSLKE